MFRQTVTTARIVISRRPYTYAPCAPHASPFARFNIKSYSSTPQPPKKDSPTTIALTFGALVAGACTFYYISQSNGSGTRIPSLTEPASESTIAIASPVKVYNLNEANTKIREQATSFTFDGKDGNGRVDVVRVASNNPVEDEWAVAIGKGVGGRKTLYAGVYDGHA